MEGADFDMYFYFEGEMDKGIQLAQTAQGGSVGAARDALKRTKDALKLAQTTAEMEPQGGSINMKDADFNMYFYFEGSRDNGF